jgi:hypothetical protein
MHAEMALPARITQMRGSRRAATRALSGRSGIRLQNSVVCPADVVPSRKRFFDDLQLVVHSGLEFENHAAFADGFRFENYVALAAIGDRVARVQCFDGHQFRRSAGFHA